LIPTPRNCKPQIVTVRNDEQLGFGGALEAGFMATEEPWVLFMHSDCLVEKSDWLIELGRFLLRHKKDNVRLVTARTNNAAGGSDPKLIESEKHAKREDIILEEGYVPLFCAMCHRDMFHHLRGFVKNYPYGFYEDEELANRMRNRGFKQGISGKSWVRHHGGATVSEVMKNKKVKEIMESNRYRCIQDLRSLC